MEVRNTGKYGVVIAYDSENPARAIIVSEPEAITLRDLLLREFPLEKGGDVANAEEYEKLYAKERRERIVTAVLAGMLAQSQRDPNFAADDAILQANVLIAALDK